MISIAKMHRKWNSCRRFIKTAGTAAIAAPVIMKSSISAGNEVPASYRINLGIIGCGGLGNVNLNACAAQPGVVVTAACDVWKDRLDPVLAKFRDTCTGYSLRRQEIILVQ